MSHYELAIIIIKTMILYMFKFNAYVYSMVKSRQHAITMKFILQLLHYVEHFISNGPPIHATKVRKILNSCLTTGPRHQPPSSLELKASLHFIAFFFVEIMNK